MLLYILNVMLTTKKEFSLLPAWKRYESCRPSGDVAADRAWSRVPYFGPVGLFRLFSSGTFGTRKYLWHQFNTNSKLTGIPTRLLRKHNPHRRRQQILLLHEPSHLLKVLRLPMFRNRCLVFITTLRPSATLMLLLSCA